jgi:glyoxylase-like metal-dependent hydrolase (beta-lactamase superfamily II)
MKLKCFTFGPFQENTFVLWDGTLEGVVIDPGCSTVSEEQELKQFIDENGINIKHLLNTHCHVDHIAGNAFVSEQYHVKPQIHKFDLIILESQETVCRMYGLPFTISPRPETFLEEGKPVKFGNTELEVIHTPGHAPGHVVFFHRPSKVLVNGDVLFYGSIGRTDFPHCNHDDLMHSIKEKVFRLGDDVMVYCGHGPKTSVGFERQNNPFLT